MRLALFFAAYALALTACSSSQLGAGALPYYESPDDVPRAYEVIGYVTPEATSSRSGYTSNNSRLKEAKRLAYQMGADAVLKMTDDSAATDAAMEDFVRRAGSTATGNGVFGAIATSRIQYVAIQYVREETAD
jgi:hypothetical protein